MFGWSWDEPCPLNAEYLNDPAYKEYLINTKR
jgi:hypothetical protein